MQRSLHTSEPGSSCRSLQGNLKELPWPILAIVSDLSFLGIQLPLQSMDYRSNNDLSHKSSKGCHFELCDCLQLPLSHSCFLLPVVSKIVHFTAHLGCPQVCCVLLNISTAPCGSSPLAAPLTILVIMVIRTSQILAGRQHYLASVTRGEMGIIAMDINESSYVSIFPTTSYGLHRRASNELLTDAAVLLLSIFLMVLENHGSCWPYHLTYPLAGLLALQYISILACLVPLASLSCLCHLPGKVMQFLFSHHCSSLFSRLLRASLAVSFALPCWYLPGC